jgi:hypothetical protein
MLRYRSRVVLAGSMPLVTLLRARSAGLKIDAVPPLTWEELDLEPRVFIRIRNGRVGLAAEVLVDKDAETEDFPGPLPGAVLRALRADLAAQGAGTAASGSYPVRSAKVQAFVEGPQFQRWLREWVRSLGLEVTTPEPALTRTPSRRAPSRARAFGPLRPGVRPESFGPDRRQAV